jgi:hypothetical protein
VICNDQAAGQREPAQRLYQRTANVVPGLQFLLDGEPTICRDEQPRAYHQHKHDENKANDATQYPYPGAVPALGSIRHRHP